MVFMIFSLGITIYLLTGYGRVFLGPNNITSSKNPFIYTIFAIFLLGSFTMGASLFTKINIIFFFLFVFLGIIGIFQQFSYSLISTLKKNKKFVTYYLILLLIISLFLAYKSYPYNSDTDTYHANAVEWIKQYGTVIGLANLSNRFGFNTIWHFIAATIDHSILDKRSVWILPGITYMCSFGYFGWEFFKSKNLGSKLFSLAILFWTIVNVLTWGFPSLHYDFIPLLINSILIYLVLTNILEEKKLIFSTKELFVLMSLASASFILKPMGAISVFFCGIMTLYSLYSQKNINIRNLLLIFTLPLTVFTVWSIRNILVSGWIFYPSPIFSTNFPWTVKKDLVLTTFNEVSGWAKLPGPDFMKVPEKPFSFWLIPWLKNSVTSIRFIAVGTIPFFVSLVSLFTLGKKLVKREVLFLVLWCLGNLLFWFSTAPDIRFGDGLIITFCGVTTCLSINYSKIKSRLVKLIPFELEFILSILLIFGLVISLTLYTGKRGPVNLWEIGHHEAGPIVKEKITLKNGTNLDVWVPVSPKACLQSQKEKICKGDLSIYNDVPNCGNSPLPCTNFFNKNLRLIKSGDLSSGFIVQ